MADDGCFSSIVAVVVVLGCVGWWGYEQYDGERQRANQLAAKLASYETGEKRFKMEEACSAHAAKSFTADKWDQPLTGYASHFNLRLNRCLMSIHSWQGTVRGIMFLDPLQRVEVASFWIANGEKVPQSCQLQEPGLDVRYCQSEKEFEALTGKLMLE